MTLDLANLLLPSGITEYFGSRLISGGAYNGTEDLEVSTQLYIYPNPTQDILFIESQQPIETMKIYNLQGRLIKEAALKVILMFLSLSQECILSAICGRKNNN